MKFPRFAVGTIFFLAMSSLGFPGCGGNGTVLTISPAGPTIVLKGTTLQFTASRADVTWSVPGSGNGTISNLGLYTPPATLPVGIPLVTVQAKSSNGQVATAQISLRTADSLTFGAPSQVNANPIDASFLLADLELGGVSDRLSVRLGTVQEDTVFAGPASANPTPTPMANVFYSQALNFAPFSTPTNVGNNPADFQAPIAIETDSHENPGILFDQVDFTLESARIFFMGSSDQGAHFNAPVPVAPGSPATNVQAFGSMRVDDQDRLHVVFEEIQPTPSPEVQSVLSLQSADGGATWSNPVTVTSSTTNGVQFPNLAISPAGDKLYVCWTDTNSSNDNILFSVSSDGGTSFGTPVPVTTSNLAMICRVAVGPQGELYVVYSEDNGSGKFNIVLKASLDGGTTFGAPMQVNSDPTNATIGFPMISVDDLGRIDVTWSADPDNSGDLDTLMYARSTDGGAHFTSNAPIASGTSGTSSTGSAVLSRALRHDVSGRLYVQYLLGKSIGGPPSGTYDIFTLVGE